MPHRIPDLDRVLSRPRRRREGELLPMSVMPCVVCLDRPAQWVRTKDGALLPACIQHEAQVAQDPGKRAADPLHRPVRRNEPRLRLAPLGNRSESQS